jgi:putative endopeptidase
MQWQAVLSVSAIAAKELINENFNFYGKFLNGQKALRPRWKECVASIDTHLGEARGVVASLMIILIYIANENYFHLKN